MDISEIRNIHLDYLRQQCNDLVQMMRDPDFCNDAYKPFNELLEGIKTTCKDIITANNTEQDARQAMEKIRKS